MIKHLGVSAAFLLSLASLLVSCNDETTNVTESTGLSVIGKGEKMVECTSNNVGDMVFVEDSSSVYYCADGAWRTLKGENGENGREGSSTKDTVVVNKRDTVVVRDTVVRLDTTVKLDTTVVLDTTTLLYVPEYDTVTTEFLNQEMLAAGKYGILVDKRDNKVYRTVKIGTQTWMAQNLDYNDGGVTSYCYGNDIENCKKYGRFYTWATVMNLDEMYNSGRTTKSDGSDSVLVRPVQGICPTGWHVPDTSEWNLLERYITSYNAIYYEEEGVGTSLRSKEKLAGWEKGDGIADGTDRFGFSWLPSGIIANNKGSYAMGREGSGWSSTEIDGELVYSRFVSYDYNTLRSWNLQKIAKRTVRCLKD